MSTTLLRVQHTSLQFSDPRAQQEHDVKALFQLGAAYPIKTGTESGPDAGPNSNREFMKEYAAEFGHALHMTGDNWVAVDRKIIKPGSLVRSNVFVAKTGEVYGPGHHSQMPVISFDHIDPKVGHISYGGCHYPTKGQTPAQPNWDINKRYAEKIGAWMRSVAKGTALAFIAGDFNMPDQKGKPDWAFGQPWTSMADELKAWQNTGHGPIDGFASYDGDGRVSAKRFNVLDDTEMKMYSDHWVCRGVWEIKHLKL